MALILEVLDPRTGAVQTRVRIRLDALPLAVGRGFGNDVILDDPYVDARHARITADESGALVVEDLGSLNGTIVQDHGERTGRLAITPGTVVRIGRTTLRFRDPDEPVPTALLDVPEKVAPESATRRWLGTRWGRLGIPAAAAVCVAASTWLHSYERSSGSDTYMGVLAFLFIGVLWASIWATAGRIVTHRFRFLEHLAIASLAAMVGLTFSVVTDWSAFLFPDNVVYGPLAGIVSLVLIATLVASHLAFASALATRSRWRAGVLVSVVLLALGGAAALAESETFTDVPEFSGVLKPFRAQWIPARSVESFGGTATDLKKEVDELAIEK